MRPSSRTMWVSLLYLVASAAAVAFTWEFFDLQRSDLLALVSLLIVLFVAGIQQVHLTRLGKIGEQTAGTAVRTEVISVETREITNRLRIDRWLEDNINGFFGISRGDGKRYECVFPVQYGDRPTPLINTGDYHALEVLTSRLGAERLQLNPCLRRKSAEIRGPNVIFICGPEANPMIVDIFNPKDKIPCWISVPQNEPKRLRIIEENSQVTHHPSPCEDSYKEAKELQARLRETGKAEDIIEGKLHKAHIRRVFYVDYGILARLTDGDKRHVLIAGLHQPGTWIVAEYLDRLLTRPCDDTSSVFFQPYDFAAVIQGKFDGTRHTVEGDSIYLGYWWQKRGDVWAKVS